MMSLKYEIHPSWAKLTFTPDIFNEPVDIRNTKFIIGRIPNCDLPLRDKKHISAKHCQIEKDPDGRIYVKDLSANGTFVNNELIGKGKRKEIKDSSVVNLVKRGNAHDLWFTFKLLPERDIDQTVAYTPEAVGVNNATLNDHSYNGGASRGSTDGEPTAKKPRVDVADTAASISSSTQSASTSAKGNTGVNASTSNAVGPSTKPKDDDAIADNLVCAICFDIIHDCVSLQPCMHCFCAGCYSDWMQRSKECPECRVKVRRINKNHVVNNVINAYLAMNPDKMRSDEEIKNLDAKNKITAEMLKAKGKQKADAAANDEHPSDCDCSDCDEDYDDTPPPTGDPVADVVAALRNGNMGRPTYVPQCRSCAGYYGFPPINTRVRPIQQRVCPPGQPHILCQCCFANMPDRRQERDPAVPPISCTVCQRAFCDLYFGCARTGCTGCLARFKDVKFPDATYNDLINNNPYETNILKDHLARKNKTWSDVFKECVEKMASNEFYCPDKAGYQLTSESPLCQTCALRNYRTLVYQYRQHIRNEDLPADVTRRDDCYWGKNCRTQKKFHHAAKFNHICEQTKF